jgi:hypothetical protein
MSPLITYDIKFAESGFTLEGRFPGMYSVCWLMVYCILRSYYLIINSVDFEKFYSFLD